MYFHSLQFISIWLLIEFNLQKIETINYAIIIAILKFCVLKVIRPILYFLFFIKHNIFMLRSYSN